MSVPFCFPPPKFPGAPATNAMTSEKAFAANEVEAAVRKLDWALKTFREAERESHVYNDIVLNNRVLTARISALSSLVASLSEGEIAQTRNASTSPIKDTEKAPRRPLSDITEAESPANPVKTGPQIESAPTLGEAVSRNSASMGPISEAIGAFTSILGAGVHNITPGSLVSGVDVNKSSPWPQGIPKGFASAEPVMAIPEPTTTYGNLPIQITQRNGARSEYEDRDFSMIDGKRRNVKSVPAPPPVPKVAPPANGPKKGFLTPFRRFFPLCEPTPVSPILSPPSLVPTTSKSSDNGPTTPVTCSLFYPTSSLRTKTNSTDGGPGSSPKRRAEDTQQFSSHISVESGPKRRRTAAPSPSEQQSFDFSDYDDRNTSMPALPYWCSNSSLDPPSSNSSSSAGPSGIETLAAFAATFSDAQMSDLDAAGSPQGVLNADFNNLDVGDVSFKVSSKGKERAQDPGFILSSLKQRAPGLLSSKGEVSLTSKVRVSRSTTQGYSLPKKVSLKDKSQAPASNTQSALLREESHDGGKACSPRRSSRLASISSPYKRHN